MPVTEESTLTKAERRRLLRAATGTAFDPWQPIVASYDGGAVLDYSGGDAADIATMLDRDGRARSTHEVLTLPVRGAPSNIEPDDDDTGQAQLIKHNLGDKLCTIIDQMTTAVAFRRAFFELTWKFDDGKFLYD